MSWLRQQAVLGSKQVLVQARSKQALELVRSRRVLEQARSMACSNLFCRTDRHLPSRQRKILQPHPMRLRICE